MTRANSIADLRKHSTGEWTVVDDATPRPPIALSATEAAALGMTGAAVEAGLEQDTNPLAAKFEHLWQTWDGPELVNEYRFHPHRRWRLDYYHAPTQTGIEQIGRASCRERV